MTLLDEAFFSMDRRHFIQYSSAASLALVSTEIFAKSKSGSQFLHLKNMHTNEEERIRFSKNGLYIPKALETINRLLRDHHSGEIHPIDLKLIESLYNIHKDAKAPYGIEIYSGYRSHKTNEALRKKHKGVAKKSYHMKGRAVDIRMPGTRLSTIRDVAISLRAGGVGYYQRSGFLHIDTGRVRQWRG